MDAVKVADLQPLAALESAIHDPLTGRMLVRVGDPLTLAGIRAIREMGLEKVLRVGPLDDADALERAANYQKIELKDIPPDTVAQDDIYTTDGSLLLAKGARLSVSMLESLSRRRVFTVLVRKAQNQEHLARLNQAQSVLARERTEARKGQEDFSRQDRIEDTSVLDHDVVMRMSERFEQLGALVVEPDGKDALIHAVQMVDALRERAPERKEEYVDLYRGLIHQTQAIFEAISEHQKIDGRAIAGMCDQVIRSMIADRELLLAALFLSTRQIEYLARHSVNVSVLSVNIAASAGYSREKVMEVGYGALLSDIGMLSIPDKIRFKQTPLTLQEMMEVRRHTIYGMDRLQCITTLPKTTPLVAYQCHERLDGSGYPHGKKKNALHDYSKLVAVADVYHAMIDKRPYRPGSTLPYKAMEELLKLSSRRKIDQRFVRALLSAVSLFPVGSWVRLNTGEIARVLAAHEKEFTKPTVAIMFDREGNSVEPRRLDLRERRELQVVAPADIDDVEELAGF